MITNNNFNPLSGVFFVNKLLIFDCLFSLYEVTMTEQIPDKKGDSPEVWRKKDNKEGEAREGRKSFWVDYIYSKVVRGLGTIY